MSTSTTNVASIVLIGCGCPLRSMGWYHAEQLLNGRCPSGKLMYIVEPFYMNSTIITNIDTPGYKEFHHWRTYCETMYNIKFYQSVSQVPTIEEEEKEKENNERNNSSTSNTKNCRMGLICSRTCDNPQLFNDCLQIGCSVIYLEKPGAPTVEQLESMQNNASTLGVKVYVGFNKNVSSYVSKTLQYAKQQEQQDATTEITKKLDITFVHNNAYTDDPLVLAECFERNSEGMLKNMAIHELAILVTYFDVTVDTIQSVVVDKKFSSCRTVQGPASGTMYTDFDKIKFKIITTTGKEATIVADRCGGDDSIGIVSDSSNGTILAQYTMPDSDTVAAIPKLATMYTNNDTKYPHGGTIMPYFLTQDPDYCELKERIAKSCASNNTILPVGAATIQIAIDALKLAEYLTPILQEQLTS